MFNVVISPGHTLDHKGVFKNGHHEFDEVSKVVDNLFIKLSSSDNCKVTVVTGKLIDKIRSINELLPDLAVEIHLGNTNNSTVSGSRSFYDVKNKNGKLLASLLLEECVRLLGTHNKGSYIGWFKKISPSMVRLGKAPEGWKPKIDLFLSKVNSNITSAIIEPVFLSSASDTENYITANKHEFIAESIYRGILRYIKEVTSE